MYTLYKKVYTFTTSNKQKQLKMTTKPEQQNIYNLTNSDGSISEIYIIASNLKEAIKIAKEKHPHKLYFGKVVRCYNGGIMGSR